MIKLEYNNFEKSKTELDSIFRVQTMKWTIILLSVVCIGSIVVRLHYFPFGVPITLDGIDYFSYAMELSKSGRFPYYQGFSNNGWPSFLSIFFSIYNSDNFLNYMMIQRYLALVLSVITIIPVYLLCKRFFSNKYALAGAVLFAFDPRLIQNSLLGLTEPFFILLGITSFFLFLSRDIRSIYASFGVLGLTALVRYESLLLIIPFSIMYFARFRNERRVIAKYSIALSIFILVLLPMTYIRIETTGTDGLISHLLGGTYFISDYVIQGLPEDDDPVPGPDYQNKILIFMMIAISNLTKYIAWVMIPTLIFFVPIGVFMIIKNRSFRIPDHKISTMIFFSLVVLIPAVYAYGRDIQETRYLFMVFPLFYLVSIYTIKKLTLHLKPKRIVLVLLILCIITASLVFLEYKKTDYEHEREAFVVATEIVKVANGINSYSESKYIKPAEIAKKWPELPKSSKSHIALDTIKIPATGYDSLERFIVDSKPKGLTHLVVDDSIDNPNFLTDIFKNDKKYTYLKKTYDSSEQGMSYHIKIYKINFEGLN